MTNERKETLLKILLADEATAKKTLAMTPAEAVRYLADHGETAAEDEVRALAAELTELAKKVNAAKDANGGELSEAQLEQIAGGWDCMDTVGAVWAGICIGFVIASIPW